LSFPREDVETPADLTAFLAGISFLSLVRRVCRDAGKRKRAGFLEEAGALSPAGA
jgi:hypothetical protein